MIALFSRTRSLIRSHSPMISLLALADNDGALSTGPLQAESAGITGCVGHVRFAGVDLVADVELERLAAELAFELLPGSPQPTSNRPLTTARSDQMASLRVIPVPFLRLRRERILPDLPGGASGHRGSYLRVAPRAAASNTASISPGVAQSTGAPMFPSSPSGCRPGSAHSLREPCTDLRPAINHSPPARPASDAPAERTGLHTHPAPPQIAGSQALRTRTRTSSGTAIGL
jgi:hypothetical protein